MVKAQNVSTPITRARVLRNVLRTYVVLENIELPDRNISVTPVSKDANYRTLNGVRLDRCYMLCLKYPSNLFQVIQTKTTALSAAKKCSLLSGLVLPTVYLLTIQH